jgi:hypothetical protein
MSEVGSIGIVPIGHVAYQGTINWKNRLESSPQVLGSTLGTQVPTTTSSKSVGGSSTITKSRSFCRPRPNPIRVPKHCYQDAP